MLELLVQRKMVRRELRPSLRRVSMAGFGKTVPELTREEATLVLLQVAEMYVSYWGTTPEDKKEFVQVLQAEFLKLRNKSPRRVKQ